MTFFISTFLIFLSAAPAVLPAAAPRVPAGVRAPTVKSSDPICARWGIFAVEDGRYSIQINEWQSKAKFCMAITGSNFRVTASEIDEKGAFPGGYPSIYQGCAWGGAPEACTVGSPMPIPLKKLKSARTDWSFTIPSNIGQYDAGYDIWFNKTTAHDKQPTGCELGITFSHGPGWTPGGDPRGRVKIGGATYSVFARHGTPNFITYRADKQVTSVTNLPLDAFFRDAAKRGYIDPAWYLQSVQAGFEVWHGGVGLASNSFSLSIK